MSITLWQPGALSKGLPAAVSSDKATFLTKLAEASASVADKIDADKIEARGGRPFANGSPNSPLGYVLADMGVTADDSIGCMGWAFESLGLYTLVSPALEVTLYAAARTGDMDLRQRKIVQHLRALGREARKLAGAC